MAEAHLKPKHDWKGTAIGIGATLLTAMILAFGGFMIFGFEKYVENIAAQTLANDGVPQATITHIQSDITDIKSTLEIEAQRDREFREQQAADMRNLVSIISRRGPDG